MKSLILPLLIAGAIRYYLALSEVSTVIGNRVEISTPLNSFKRVKEGTFLYGNGISPYIGDVVHEIPLILMALRAVFESAPSFVPLLYVILDLSTAFLLYMFARQFTFLKLKQQKKEKLSYAVGTENLQLQLTDKDSLPQWVLMAYLFNPLSIANCVGLTSTVFSNFLLSLTLFFVSKKWLLPSLLALALEAMRNLYPVVLIAPIVLVFSQRSIRLGATIVTIFISCCIGVAFLNFGLAKSWSFLDGTLGFIFFYRDLQPNIGLFWYFFTEMFEHFRTMFLITFQMNATVLYLLPLSLKLRKEPFLLFTVLIQLMSIFRSYPCLGDVGFYLALLPLWRKSWKFMAHSFVVFCFFTLTLCMMPAVWHLWIYAGSANANFYFGTTLAFCTGQIFLCTDLLFAYIKRDFCLHNGLQYYGGKDVKIVLD